MRLFGAALVAASSVLSGFWFSKRLSYAAEACWEILRIMKYVRDEIAINKTPTRIILERLGARFGVSADQPSSLYGALMPRLSALSSEEAAVFNRFCEQIGKDGAEVQRTQFDSLISQLEERAEKRRAELSKNSRLYVSVSLFVGVLIIIIMI